MTEHTSIVGAGVAGLGVAHELARRGHSVTLLDAASHLGGHAIRWACMATDRCQRCGVCQVHDLVAAVQASPRIRLLLGHRVTRVRRANGRLTLRAERAGGQPLTLESDTLVLATGFEPFDPAGARPIGNEDIPGAVTSVALNEALRTHDLHRLGFSGGDAKRVAFLQCVGSRDPEAGRPYCSQVCCEGTLRFARRLLHLRPDWSVTVFYIDLQTYGKEARSRLHTLTPSLRLVQGVPAEIRPVDHPAAGCGAVAYQGADGSMRLETFDGFVMAVGMVAPQSTRDLISELQGVRHTTGGFLRLADPPEPGVYVVGTAQGPNSIEGCLLQARKVAADLLARRAGHGPTSFQLTPLVRTIEPEPNLPSPSSPSRGDSTGGAESRLAPTELDPAPARERRTAGGPASTPEPPPETEPIAVNRTVAVLGEGAEADLVSAALQSADLPVLRLPARRADRSPVWNRLSGSLGRFTLRRCRESADAGAPQSRRAHPGAEQVTAGAVVLAPGPQPSPSLPAPEGEGPVSPAPEQVPPHGPWALWLDPEGPAWRPAAAAALEVATAGAEAGQDVTVLARHVPLPGLSGQERYDALRASGARILRLADTPPAFVGNARQGNALLAVQDEAAPETPARLALRMLSVVPLPRPPTDLAESLSIRTDREGFAQAADVRLEPIATDRVGVFAFGSARGEALPSDLRAEAAALALEIRSLLASETLPFPPAPIEIDSGRCTRCLTCVRACPHQALEIPETQGSPPRIDPVACQACGQCRAVCPARAIAPRGKMRRRPREQACPITELEAATPHLPRHGVPKVAVLACQHSGAPALRAAMDAGLLPGENLSLRVLPCAGAVDELCLLGALRTGAPRVAVLTCHPDACAHHQGPQACTRRVAALTPLLRGLGLPEDTLSQFCLAPAEAHRLAKWLGALLDLPPSGTTASASTQGATQ